MMVNMSDLGNQMGSMMKKGLDGQKAPASDPEADPFRRADTMLGGLFVSMGRGLGQTGKSITDLIAGSALGSAVGDLYSGSMLDTAVGGVSDGFNFARNTINYGINKVKGWGMNALKGVKDFAVDTYDSMFGNNNDKNYQIVMTDAGPAKKYSNGDFEFVSEFELEEERWEEAFGGDMQKASHSTQTPVGQMESESFFSSLWNGVKNVTGFGEGGLWEKTANWVKGKGFITDQKYNDIQESRAMWQDGTMQEEIFEYYKYKDDQYVARIKESYRGKKIWDTNDNPNNVREYSGSEYGNGNSEGFDERIGYYKYLVQQKYGADIAEVLASGKPIVIGEEGKGAGVEALTSYGVNDPKDRYDDRQTKITMRNGEIVIQEFNRSNVDTSNKYPSVQKGSNLSVAEGEYDFIVGKHVTENASYKALNIFDINNTNRFNEMMTTEITEKYNNNTLIWQDVKGDYGKLRFLKNILGGGQKNINLHKGYNNGSGSKGCFTVYKHDYGKFIDNMDFNQIGKYYLVR